MTRATLAGLASAEGSKLARQPSTRVLAAILVAYLVVMVIAFYSILSAPEMEGFDKESFLAPLRAQPLGYMVALFSGTGIIIMVVFGAMLIGNEFSRGTLRTLLLAGVDRTQLVLAKLATILAIAIPFALVGILFAIGGLYAFSAATGEDLVRFGATDVSWSLFGMALALWGWAVIAFAITLYSGSLGVGIGSALGLLIVGDILAGLIAGAGDIGTYAARLLPNAGLGVLQRGSPPDASTWAWALPNLVVYLGGLPWLALQKFQRADALAATRQ